MITAYHVEGKKIIRVCHPGKTYAETEIAAYCDEPDKALAMMLKAWGLNEDRKYSASARLFAQIENLPGFAWGIGGE